MYFFVLRLNMFKLSFSWVPLNMNIVGVTMDPLLSSSSSIHYYINIQQRWNKFALPLWVVWTSKQIFKYKLLTHKDELPRRRLNCVDYWANTEC